MKLVNQRVKKAKVTSCEERKVAGEIDIGLLVLVGFGIEDNEEIVKSFGEKLVNVRIMGD